MRRDAANPAAPAPNNSAPEPIATSGIESEPVVGSDAFGSPDGELSSVPAPFDPGVEVVVAGSDVELELDEDDEEVGGVPLCSSTAPMSAIPFETRTFGVPR